MVNNLNLYERVRSVPKEAQKEITAGRLKGKTDINPMWRIKKLTEEFGTCGFGWYTNITDRWIEEGANGERTANIKINLFVKMNGEWSMPIEGIGGSVLVAKESAGLRTDDDCFKKAYTDAISVACKALGFGGDIYWQKDPSKYDNADDQPPENKPKNGANSNVKAKPFQPITKAEMVEKWGVKNVEETVAWFEKKLGVKMANWNEDMTNDARAVLEAQKAKREREAEKMREQLKNTEGELPFDL